MEKMAWDGPKWGQEDFFPTNPDLAHILGRTDVDFDNFDFFGSQIPRNLAWARLGPSWAGPGSESTFPRQLRGSPGGLT